MEPWIPLFLASNLVYWLVFAYLAMRHRPSGVALALGAMHMLLAAALSVAPFRSFLDPHYPGFGLGVLHFEKRAATLPAALLLTWALASAWLLVSRRRGRTLWVVAVGDVLFALNQLLGVIRPGSSNDIQFGEYLTIRGFQALLIMGILLVGGPAFSAWWAGTKARKTIWERRSR
jgi:hypothetical protein